VYVTLYSNSSGTFSQNNFSLSFSPRGLIHATTTFVFPALPSTFFNSTTQTIFIDLGDGVNLTYPTGGGTLTISYPSVGYYTISYGVMTSGGLGSFVGSESIQLKFNSGVTYSDYAPDKTWLIAGNSYTPLSSCAAYPTGSTAPSFTATGPGYGRAYVKYARLCDDLFFIKPLRLLPTPFFTINLSQ
jgi:hypothetical protein